MISSKFTPSRVSFSFFFFFLWYDFLRGNFIFTAEERYVLADVREQATIGSSFARHLLAKMFLFLVYYAYTVYETFWVEAASTVRERVY